MEDCLVHVFLNGEHFVLYGLGPTVALFTSWVLSLSGGRVSMLTKIAELGVSSPPRMNHRVLEGCLLIQETPPSTQSQALPRSQGNVVPCHTARLMASAGEVGAGVDT